MPPVLYTVNSTCRIFSDITKKKRYKLYGVIPIPFNCSNKKFPTFFSKDFAWSTAVSCLLMGGDAARHASPVSKGALDSPGRRWWFLEQAFTGAGWMECSARMECLSTLHGVLSLEGVVPNFKP